jgi:hypothetical protein
MLLTEKKPIGTFMDVCRNRLYVTKVMAHM